MPNFTELFEQTEKRPIHYKGLELFRVDKFPISNKEKIILSIESTKSERLQGVVISIKGHCKMQGEVFKKGKKVNMVFWEKSDVYDPKNIELTIFTKEKFVTIWNIWEGERHGISCDESGNIIETTYKAACEWLEGAAMIVEEIEDGRRYRCNDRDPDEDFDDIVFTVKRAQ